MAAVDDDDDPFLEQREQAESAMPRLFAEYGRPNAWYFLVGLAGSVVARVLDLLPPLLLGFAIDAVIRNDQPFSLPLVPDAMVPAAREDQLLLVVAIIAVAFFGGAAFHWGRNWGWNSFAQNIQHSIRTDTYDKMQRLTMEFFSDKQTGEMMSVLSNDVNRLERFLNESLNVAFIPSLRNRSNRFTSFESTDIISPVCLSEKNSMVSRCILS